MKHEGEKGNKIISFLLKSRVTSENVKLPEMFLGYLAGPFLALITNAVYTSFLNRFYTDILGMVGSFITLLPLVSTIFVCISNIIVGSLIDKMRTNMGKARPCLLVSGPLIFIAIFLMFTVPSGNDAVKIVWVAISYNLYYSLAYPIYNLSHSMMVPLSTRDSNQRGTLSVVTNVANMGAAGLFAAIIFPMLIYPRLKNQSAWLSCMCILGGLAFVGIILEFMFTRERITEEGMQAGEKAEEVPKGQQIKAVVSDPYWWMIILFYLLFNVSGGLKNLAMSYYCDYVVGSYQDGVTQTVLATISGLPMALGVVAAWPIANKFGKKNSTVVGLIIAALGGSISMIHPDNFLLVAVSVTIKTLGTIPACYVMMALFADVLDHLEAKNGYRCDGFSMSLYSIIMVSASGVCTAVFNGLISASGYVAPRLVDGVMVAATQNDDTKWIFIICFLAVEVAAYSIIAVMLSFLKVEKNIAAEQQMIKERHEAANRSEGK